MLPRPAAPIGLHHVALFVPDLAAAEHFYVDLMGMRVEWRPDPDNVYLTGGRDNLALHRLVEAGAGYADPGSQKLDHIGFVLRSPEDVDAWFVFLKDAGVSIKTEPRTHRDGARSFYCEDPAGITVQLIHHPPLAG
ncbi:VOC family protein [Thermithiobacillus plumbiphilus]|uniref:VOC family protein n=1 Tax=Thermithiobacillus plumbiphilus TaxID=1729899 RepID=A0ABU9D8H0_9PROT